jgi:hypothetical protein
MPRKYGAAVGLGDGEYVLNIRRVRFMSFVFLLFKISFAHAIGLCTILEILSLFFLAGISTSV